MEELYSSGSLAVFRLVLGMVHTNTYIAVDLDTGEAVVVDPAGKGSWLAAQAQERGWRISSLWFTHAHFDHIAGAAALVDALEYPVSIALHPADLPLYNQYGGAELFGLPAFDLPGEPDQLLDDGERLPVGAHTFRVHSTPGHSPGHVIYAAESSPLVFCGDLIFKGGVGRTDLPGGDWNILEQSIRTRVYSLPPETILFPGHGDRSTVGEERSDNPFVQGVI